MLINPKIKLAPHMVAVHPYTLLHGMKLMVCDMSGTTVQENGIAYSTIHKIVNNYKDVGIHPWHRSKNEDADVFIKSNFVKKAYLKNSGINYIHTKLPEFFVRVRNRGIKIALDTRFPPHIQDDIVERLELDKLIDCHISSYSVSKGRPFPYIIHNLMEQLGIEDVRTVVKIGDSCKDIKMGRNAGCGLVVGVLTGSDNSDQLFDAGADVVVDCIVDLIR